MKTKEPDISQLAAEDPASEDAFFKLIEFSAKYHGIVNYYNDDLILDFNDVSFGMKDGIMSGNYNFTIMESKYSVQITFSISFEELMSVALSEVQTDEFFRGPIINIEGEQIGVFVVYGDDSVEIFDNNGNSLKTAG